MKTTFSILISFFLSILFLYSMPHFYNQAFAATEISYCNWMLFNPDYTNINNILGAPDGIVAPYDRSHTENPGIMYSICKPQTNLIATASAIIDVQIHQLSYFNQTGYFGANIYDLYSNSVCHGVTPVYVAGTTLIDHTFTFTPHNCPWLTPENIFYHPLPYSAPDNGMAYIEIRTDYTMQQLTGAVDAQWIQIDYTPGPSPTPTPTPTPKTPVIFIPGIMGSEFEVKDANFKPGINNCINVPYSYSQGDTVWLTENPLIALDIKACGKYLDVLSLDQHGNDIYGQVGLKGTITNNFLGVPIAYHDILNYFQNEKGYQLNKNFFIFPYDWRKGLKENIIALNEKIDTAIASTGATKVQIVAHSMGGLIARDYIRDSQRAKKVDTLIELGTPHVGTPTFLAHLLYKKCVNVFNLVCIINGDEIYKLVQNFLGAFELLPSQSYYQLYSDSKDYPFNDGRDIDKNGVKGALDYNQIKTLLSDLGKNMSLFDNAESYHDTLDASYNINDSLHTDTNGVKIYLIAGSGQPTIGQIHDYYGFTTVWGSHVELPFGPPKLDADATNGDDTVPLLSATLGKLSQVYYVKQNHGSLPSGTALQMTYNLLHGQIADIPGVQVIPFAFNGKIISVHSPVVLNAYDSLGNHTGIKDDGTIELGIPGSSYDELGESKFIYLPSGGNYNIKTKATSEGSFDLKIKTYAQSTLTQELLYLAIPQTTDTTSAMTLNSDNPTLEVDTDNNGNVDKTINPSSIISGEALTDTQAPNTTVQASGTQGTNDWYTSNVDLSFTSQDSGGAGILNTYYYKDGEQTLHEAGDSVTVDTEGTTKIWYFSVDKAGNTEQPKSITVNIDKTNPTIQITNPKNDATYILNSTVVADWNVDDNLSGISSSNGTVASGNVIDAKTVGTHEFTITAADNAGNVKKTTITYKVIYRFDGFLQPINDIGHQQLCGTPCLVSIFKGGTTVPVKFQLKDANGIIVQTNNLPQWITPQQGNAITANIDETIFTDAATNGTTFSWDIEQYHYNWGTKGITTGYYYLVGVRLDDGQTYTVNIGLR